VSAIRDGRDMSDISQVFEVDDSLWVGVDISGNRQGEYAVRFT